MPVRVQAVQVVTNAVTKLKVLLLVSPCLLHTETVEGFERVSSMDSSCSSPPEDKIYGDYTNAEFSLPALIVGL